jgi:hypothetical protein
VKNWQVWKMEGAFGPVFMLERDCGRKQHYGQQCVAECLSRDAAVAAQRLFLSRGAA